MTSGAGRAGHQPRPCWFVGANYETDGDQTERFRSDGVWEMEQWDARAHDRYVRQVKSMQPGDRIAIKSTYVRKNGINFDNAGKRVSVMAIKAVGEITENPGNGHSVKVNWTRSDGPREWYFYTNRGTVWEVTPNSGAIPWAAEALIKFTFENEPQDYKAFLEGPWRDHYTDPWDDFVERAKGYRLNNPKHDEEEIDWKIGIGRQYGKARELVLAASDAWGDAIRRVKPHKLLYFTVRSKFDDWTRDDPAAALHGLQALWATDDRPLAERIRGFCQEFPRDRLGGTGTRLKVVSVLLMGQDPEQYPLYGRSQVEQACKQTVYPLPRKDASEAELYEHALGFLDRFIKEAEARDLRVRHRLDAESIVWRTMNIRDDGGSEGKGTGEDKPPPPPPRDTLEALAEDLYLPVDFLRNIETLLRRRSRSSSRGRRAPARRSSHRGWRGSFPAARGAAGLSSSIRPIRTRTSCRATARRSSRTGNRASS